MSSSLQRTPLIYYYLIINMAVFSWSTASERSANPITKFLEWKWAKTDWFFSYYDKESQSNNHFDLNLPFIILKTGWSIKWYSPASWGFWSNEVEDLNQEKITIRAKDWVVAEWLYAEVKAKAVSMWGKLQRVLTVLYDGQVIAFALKWAALSSFIEFTKNNAFYMRNKIVLADIEDKKNWAIEYKVPVFAIDSPITEAEGKEAEKHANVVAAYYKPESNEDVVAEVEDENEDLPF